MTLIWNELLHANFRCGRMYSARAERICLTQSCARPSAARMCRPTETAALPKGNDNWISGPGTEQTSVPGLFCKQK